MMIFSSNSQDANLISKEKESLQRPTHLGLMFSNHNNLNPDKITTKISYIQYDKSILHIMTLEIANNF